MVLASGTRVGEYIVAEFLGSDEHYAQYVVEHPILGKRALLTLLLATDPVIVAGFIAEVQKVNQAGKPRFFGFGVLPDGRNYVLSTH